MVYFAFDPMGLAIIITACFIGGLFPLLFLIARCPEAKTFIKCQLSGGIIISKTNAAGQREYVIAQPFGTEGQYIVGRNEYGQREIYVRPHTANGQFNKSFILSGIRRPIFDAFSGKTIMVPPNVLAAIQVAESDKTDLPSDIRRWAETNNITVSELKEISRELVDPDNPTTKTTITETKENFVVKRIIETDPTKLHQYFSGFFAQSQFDVLLQKADQHGYLRGLGIRNTGAGGSKKWLIVGIFIFIIIMIVGIVGLMATGAL